MGFVTLAAFGSDPVTVTGPALDNKVDPLATEFNGNIENVNIKSNAAIAYSKLYLTGSLLNADISSSAAIVDTKLAQITTALKVHATSITGLASMAPGAGILPIANLASGTPTGVKFIRDDGTLQSAVSAGTVIQVQMSQSAAVDSSTTALPVDNSIPQITEGEELAALSVTITPASSSNILVFDVLLFLQHSAGLNIGLAVFQDSTANAIFAGYINDNVAFQPGQAYMQFKMTAGTTSATTFSFRYGPTSASGTVYANADSTGTQRFNGKLYSSVKISEVKV